MDKEKSDSIQKACGGLFKALQEEGYEYPTVYFNGKKIVAVIDGDLRLLRHHFKEIGGYKIVFHKFGWIRPAMG